MKQLAWLSIFLLAACGSSSNSFGIPETRTIRDCEHGDLSIGVGFPGPKTAYERLEDQIMFMVEVSNNSRHDVTVKAIRVEQTMTETARYRVGNTYRAFNVTIAEDEEKEFELPMSGFQAVDYSGRSPQSDEMQFAVTVVLEGGDTYRCLYSVPAPVA